MFDFERKGSGHTKKFTTGLQSHLCGKIEVDRRWFEDPPVHVSATFGAHDLEGLFEHFGSDCGHVVAMVRVDHEVETPTVVASRHLGICDGVVVVVFPSDDGGKPATAALAQVEPHVIGQ